MIPDEAMPGRYYGLVKNHKEKESWPPGQNIPPLRPVVSGSGTVSEGVSHWLDEQAKQEVRKLDSYLEDTRHVLEMIEEENSQGPQPSGTIPVTLDIAGMYTNVPLEQGLLAFQAAMDKREDMTIPTEYLVRLMKFVCTSNIFVFDTKLFLQLLGVAMGSRSSPTFACIFVGMLEVVMLLSWSQTGGQMPYWWKRFIDDVLFLWRGSEESLLQFVDHLNASHPTIKFDCKAGESFNFSSKAVNFLDLTIWVDEAGYIQTTLYTKPCRIISYLLPSSSHPSHICSNIPYSLAYRLKRIESLSENLDKNLVLLKAELVSRGYRPRSIEAAFARVRLLDREDTLKKVPRPPNTRVVLSLPYDKRLPPISELIKHRHQCLLDNDVTAKDYMPLPPMLSFTRTKNLRDILIRAKLPPPQHRTGRTRPVGFKKCGRRGNCALCCHSEPGVISSYTCPITDQTVEISTPITCTDEGVYLLFCAKDNGECRRVVPTYVGECGDGVTSSFTHRFATHMGSATQQSQEDTSKPVGRHFRLPGHEPHSDLVMLPIEKSGKDPFLRKARESFYIKKFQSLKLKSVSDIEHGLNLDKGQ